MKHGTIRAAARALLRRAAQFGRSSSTAVFYMALLGSLSLVALGADLAGAAFHVSSPAAVRITAASQGDTGTTGRSVSSGAGSRSSARPAGVTGSTAARPGPRLEASVTELPSSNGLGVTEPSIALDSAGAIYVTGPSALGHDHTAVSASPLWKSSDGGASWSGPTSTETGGRTASGIGGGDSDILIDRNDDIFVTSLWLGDTTMGVSTDHGATFTTLPIGHSTPVDDRPWLAYDPSSGALYMTWDGAGALHVGKALLSPAGPAGQLVSAQDQLLFAQDIPAVPNEPDRGCGACPPGTIAVDPSGNVSVAFTGPKGIGIATSTDGGITWNQDYVPDSSATDHPSWGSASNIFQVLRADNQGNLYVVWTQTVDSNTGARAVFLSYRKAGGARWHTPIQVSAAGVNTSFGTLAVTSPGNVDVAYYTTWATADPKVARYDLDLTKVQGLFGDPTTVTADLLRGFHTGLRAPCSPVTDPSCPLSGGDRSLGDFFSIAVDGAGLADIITVADCGSDHCLKFVHEEAAPQAASISPVALTAPPPQVQAAPSSPNMTVPPAGQPSFPAISMPTPNAGTAPAGATPSTQQPGNRGRGSSPKYPGGVAVSGPPDPGGGGGTPFGLPLWSYGLAVGGAAVGRFLVRRGG